MARWSRTAFVALFACVSLWQVAGCASADRIQAVLAALEQGKAKGHLIITTSAALSVGQQTDFYVGARDTTLAFDGDIDFSDADFSALNELLAAPAAEGSETAKPEE